MMASLLVGAVSGYSMQRIATRSAVVSRAAMSKLACPRMDVTLEEAGEFGTTDFVMTFKKVRALPVSSPRQPSARSMRRS